MIKKTSSQMSLVFCVLYLLLSMLLCCGCKQKEEAADATPQQVKSVPQVSASTVPKSIDVDGATTGQNKMRILFAGHPGSDQEKEFAQLLRKHFAHVSTTDLKAFREDQADGYDVTILAYDGDGFKAPRPSLSRSFSRPLLTVGVPGAFLCGNLGLKMNYL